jgi:hypothetical protein
MDEMQDAKGRNLVVSKSWIQATLIIGECGFRFSEYSAAARTPTSH